MLHANGNGPTESIVLARHSKRVLLRFNISGLKQAVIVVVVVVLVVGVVVVVFVHPDKG